MAERRGGQIMNIKPYDSNIRKLFQSNFFKIPRFQRPYSWDQGNIEEFWADVVASAKKNHFIGSMVFYTEKDEQELFVVDGQQRLTTITIFMAALRDSFMAAEEEELANGIQNVIQRADIGTSKKRFVLLTETSYPYFQEYIQKLGDPELELEPSEEELGMQIAYDYASAGYKDIIDNAAASGTSSKDQKRKVRAALEACRDALLSLDFIVVQLDNERDAHIVFETLNTRGRDLEPKDLVKNLLTKFLPPKSADVDPTKIKWNKMLDSLSSSTANLTATAYLHHFWLSRFDYTPERTLFERIKEYLDEDNAADFLDDLHDGVEHYRRIFEPQEFGWKKEERPLESSLVALNVFRMRQPTPFIFAVLQRYYAGELSLKQAKDAISVVERFHFAYTAVSGQSSSGGVSKMYAAAGRDLTISNGPKRASHLQGVIKKLSSRFPEERVFSAGFEQVRYSQNEPRLRPLVRYILEAADREIGGNRAIDYSAMTIEHIAAQNPKTGRAIRNYSALGNLLFVPEELNGKLKNKEFADKIRTLKAAKVPLDTVLDAATEWGNKQIDDRTKALSSLVYRWAKKG